MLDEDGCTDSAMDPMDGAYLTSGEHGAWETLAGDWYIDQ